jgi:thiamine transport system substrate-binding protein
MTPGPGSTIRSLVLQTTAVTAAIGLLVASCGSDEAATTTETPTAEAPGKETPAATEPAATVPAASTDAAGTTTLTLVAYDSFPEGDTPLNDALAMFTDETGIDVHLLIAGDTGTMLAKASLTAGNPEGDVMWGVDNTFLSRAIDDGVFDPYVSSVTDIPADLTALVPNGEATPVDFGDVCVNYDIAYFADHGLDVPQTLEDLADPAYADLLVVENPGTSSPGLAFLLATIDEFGTDDWQDYWRRLDENGVEVVDGWTEAYYERFSWAGGGPRPLVVSYATSPPAEVIFADPPRDDAPTGVIESTCFRQVEFAGVLRGTEHPSEARRLVDFLAGPTFQSALPLTLFVFPANSTVDVPQEFVDFAIVPHEPRSLDPAEIEAKRSTWIDQWTEIVLS